MSFLDNIDIEKINERAEKIKSALFKSEGLKIGGSVFFGLAFLLFILPFFFNNSALKFQIEQKMSEVLNANVAINGDVKVTFLPSVAVIANDVVLKNYQSRSHVDISKIEKIYNLYAKSVKIKLPLFNFSDDVFIKELIFFDPVLEGYYNDNQPQNRQNRFTEINNNFARIITNNGNTKPSFGITAKLFPISDVSRAQFSNGNIPDITINNGEAIFYNELAEKQDIKNINLSFEDSPTKITSGGNFTSQNIASNFKFSTKFNGGKTALEIVSPIMELRLKGNITSENRGILLSDFNGKIEAKIFDLKSFYKSYINSENIVAQKLRNNSEPINISADINNESGEIGVKNLLINSDIMNGNGEIEMNFAQNIPSIDIELNLEKVDFDEIWSQESISLTTMQFQAAHEETAKTETNETKKIAPLNFDVASKIKDFDLTADIKIKTARYMGGDISDVSLYTIVSESGQILVMPLIFKTSDNGAFRIIGALDNSSSIPKFVGKLDGNGSKFADILKWLKGDFAGLKLENLKEYEIYSDIFLAPNTTKLSGFYLNLNKGSNEISGTINIDSSDKLPNINSKFNITNCNIEDYLTISADNIYLSPGLLTKKLLWLSHISSSNNIDLHFDELTFRDKKFADQNINLFIGRGSFELNNLKLKSDAGQFSMNLAVNINNSSPNLDLEIDADNFSYDSTKNQKFNIADRFYALPWLNEFGGHINIKLDNAKFDDLEVKNLNFKGKLQDGSFSNSQFSADLYGGNLTYSGAVSLKENKSLSGNITFNNTDLKQLFSNLFKINNISGIANISASVVSTASSTNEFSNSLNSEIKFSAVAPTIQGYGLNDLIKKMFDIKNNSGALRDPQKILSDQDSTTIFKQADGVAKLEKGSGKIRIDLTAPALNGILSGDVDINKSQINLLFNAIFLTGNRDKQIPINIATMLKGKFDEILSSTNIDQVKQYLGLKIDNSDNASKIEAPTTDVKP